MKKLEIKYIPIDGIKPYKNNPRLNEDAIPYVMNSIKEFGFKVPIVIDKNNEIVAGHTRYKASKKLGLEEVPCIIADDLTEEQIKAFRLADNKVAEKSMWDYTKLDEELDSILDIDMSMFDFDINNLTNLENYNYSYDNEEKRKLSDRYVITPVSIFNTQSKEWRDRRSIWDKKIPDSRMGREQVSAGNLKDLQSIDKSKKLSGTSTFDPVLCEICYKWFNVPNGNIYDPFSGGSVRGLVAQILGYKYTGIDLSQKQIEENKKQGKQIGVKPNWINDDSLNVDKYIEDNSVDMIFSCPPYAFLEKYSDDPRDLSNMDYDNFKKTYFEIIKKTCNKLKEDRFAIFVVGDIRDKDGAYVNFVDDTKKAFLENGLVFYNEIILINPIASKRFTIAKTFNAGRKITKTHQNVLVFYKGNMKKIKENYKDIINENEIVIENGD